MPSPVRSLALIVLAGLALCATHATGQDLDTNLLVNPGFENGTAGWVVTNAGVATYNSSSGLPDTAVALAIQGGISFAKDIASGQLTQTVALPDIPDGARLHVGGYFGGSGDDKDSAQLVVRFFADGPTPTTETLPAVTPAERNYETVMLLREKLLNIPPGTTSIEVVVDFTQVCCSAALAFADGLFATLTLDTLVPAPLPQDTELLVNGDFEAGYFAGSPLVLTAGHGWEGEAVGNSISAFKSWAYSDAFLKNDSDIQMKTGLPQAFGGGGALLSSVTDSTDDLISLKQRLDVRGNEFAGQFGGAQGLVLRVGANLGGSRGSQDAASVRVRFIGQSGFTKSDEILQEVGTIERNYETVLMRREKEVAVPAGTHYLEIVVEMTEVFCCYGLAFADNISAMLVSPSAPEPFEVGKNLLANPGFEDGWEPESPLTLDSPGSWRGESVTSAGFNDRVARAVGYGVDPDLIGVVPAASAGAQLLRADAIDGVIRQLIDISAHAEQIDLGALRIHAEASLGGIGSSQDAASLRLRCLKDNDVALAAPVVLGPVTAAERNNLTGLIKRSAAFDVPPLTRKVEVAVVFDSQFGCCDQYALADAISVSISVKPVKQCDAKRLKAAGRLYKGALGLHAKELKVAVFGRLELAEALAVLQAKFEKSFAESAASAAGKGETCTFQGSAGGLSAQVLAAAAAEAEASVQGLDDANAIDVGLRAKIMKLAGRYGSRLLTAEARNVQVPSPAKLAAAKAGALASFLGAVEKASVKAAKQSAPYDGLPPGELASAIEAAVGSIVVQLQ